MANFTGSLYGNVYKSMLNKEVSITAGATNLYIMLFGTGYTPNKDTHRYKSDVTNEISGTGYTAGGQALANVALSYASGVLSIACDAPNWANSTIGPVAGFAIYDRTAGTDATRALVGYGLLDTPTSSTASNFTITPTGNVLLKFTAS